MMGVKRERFLTFKTTFFLVLALAFLLLSACNVIPPELPEAQVDPPQFSIPQGQYDVASITLGIISTDPDAVIFYSVDGTPPINFDAWFDDLALLQTQVESSEDCATIFYSINGTIYENYSSWMYQIGGLTAIGQLNQQTVATCTSFIDLFNGSQEPPSLNYLLVEDRSGIEACTTVFNALDGIVNADFNQWLIQIGNMDSLAVSNCQVFFDNFNETVNQGLDSWLYTEPLTITQTTTVKALAYKEGFVPSDIITGTYTISSGIPTNQAPSVNAGQDRTITLPSTTSLVGTSIDDGLPNPPATLTHAWTRVSGPGTVTFSSPTSKTTTATFSTAGTYVLRLTADDGSLKSSDDVSVIVNSAPPVQNNPPSCTITSPLNGANIKDKQVTITVSAEDSDGIISRIDFYRDGNVLLGSIGSLARTFVWSNVGSGTYTITARAYDNLNQSNTSSGVTITVENNPENTPPVASIVKPNPNVEVTYTEGNQIEIVVEASDSDGSIRAIEFQVDGVIVFTKNISINASNFTTESDFSNESYNWTSTPGQHNISARAYDDLGASTPTNIVSVIVNPYVPPAPFCGDNVCNGAETCSSCDDDCGACSGGSGGGGGGGGGGGFPPAATCTDKKKNGNELGIDCGGSCPNKCTTEKSQTQNPESIQVQQTTGTGAQSFNPNGDGTSNQDASASGTGSDMDTTTGKSSGISLFIFIAIGLVLALLIAIFVMKKRKSSKEPKNPGIPEQSLAQCGKYIASMKAAGKSMPEIRTKMESVGWSKEQLDYVFKKF